MAAKAAAKELATELHKLQTALEKYGHLVNDDERVVHDIEHAAKWAASATAVIAERAQDLEPRG